MGTSDGTFCIKIIGSVMTQFSHKLKKFLGNGFFDTVDLADFCHGKMEVVGFLGLGRAYIVPIEVGCIYG